MKKILIIEDEMGIGNLLRDIFSHHCEVHLANNAIDVIEKIHKYKFDIIIADYFLNETNSIVAMKTHQAKLRNTPIILISGHPPQDLIEPKDNLQIIETLKKPIKFDSFIPNILKLLEN